MRTTLRRLLIAAALMSAAATSVVAQTNDPSSTPTPAAEPAPASPAAEAPAAPEAPDAIVVPTSTADHSQFKELAGPFKNAQEVNQACQSCHNTGPDQLHGTIHFTWTWPTGAAGDTAGGDTELLGMRHVANGFLLSTPSNIDACTSCHIAGTRFDDTAMFDASSEPVAPVDCLTCHEPSGQWAKANFHEGGAACSMCHDERPNGRTPEVKDLAAAAQSVGPTTRAACGACHFNADGGPGVKHGDLNADLINPAATLDVHMAAAPDGAGFTCSTCHTTKDHVIAGSRYEGGPSITPDNPALSGPAASCQSCHSSTPHKDLAEGSRLDGHIDRVACETCHIPSVARGEMATRTSWDWSTMGRIGRNRKPMVEKDKDGHATYATEKGDLGWSKDLQPTLIWSNGKLAFRHPGDPLPDDTELIEAANNNARGGAARRSAPSNDDGEAEAEDPAKAFDDAPWMASYEGEPVAEDSRIAPVKVMNSVVPVDAESRRLAAVQFSGRGGDALWNRFNWKSAVEAGMEAAGVPFSGEVAFARVRQMIPINHMVAPADQALDCGACHSSDGLLAGLPGGFLPGRDGFVLLDWAGLAILAATLAAVLLHGLLRFGFGIFYKGPRHG
ncbi:multiheme c-type cytochrome [Consotaella aegiceratis]|uniref:multiheme c-type cytochrome n=1 Tax=Consotaella aegiceratis TaxID=3097961 RepID=UPI002F3E2594